MAMVLGRLASVIFLYVNLVSVTSNINVWRLKLHERFYALIKSADVTTFQRGNEFESGEGVLRGVQDIYDFAHCEMILL